MVSDEEVQSVWEAANVMGRGKDWFVLSQSTRDFYKRMISADRESTAPMVGRLRATIRLLEEAYAGEYGNNPSTDEEMEKDDWLGLQPGDMTND